MYSPHSYIRDFYVFRRSIIPQLKILKLEQSESFPMLQEQVGLVFIVYKYGKALV